MFCFAPVILSLNNTHTGQCADLFAAFRGRPSVRSFCFQAFSESALQQVIKVCLHGTRQTRTVARSNTVEGRFTFNANPCVIYKMSHFFYRVSFLERSLGWTPSPSEPSCVSCAVSGLRKNIKTFVCPACLCARVADERECTTRRMRISSPFPATLHHCTSSS